MKKKKNSFKQRLCLCWQWVSRCAHKWDEEREPCCLAGFLPGERGKHAKWAVASAVCVSAWPLHLWEQVGVTWKQPRCWVTKSKTDISGPQTHKTEILILHHYTQRKLHFNNTWGKTRRKLLNCMCLTRQKSFYFIGLLSTTSDLCSLISVLYHTNDLECQFNSGDQLFLTLQPATLIVLTVVQTGAAGVKLCTSPWSINNWTGFLSLHNFWSVSDSLTFAFCPPYRFILGKSVLS